MLRPSIQLQSPWCRYTQIHIQAVRGSSNPHRSVPADLSPVLRGRCCPHWQGAPPPPLLPPLGAANVEPRRHTRQRRRTLTDPALAGIRDITHCTSCCRQHSAVHGNAQRVMGGGGLGLMIVSKRWTFHTRHTPTEWHTSTLRGMTRVTHGASLSISSLGCAWVKFCATPRWERGGAAAGPGNGSRVEAVTLTKAADEAQQSGHPQR